MPRIDGIFACGYDVIVFVDESEAGPAAEEGSRFVVGRVIAATDQLAVREISRVLANDNAEAWHASRRGAPNMFRSARFDALNPHVKRSLRAAGQRVLGRRRMD